MQSFFKRVPMEQVRLSLVAVYTDAKPVVVDTKDVDVVRNFLDGLDMYYAFDSGQTELFDGLIEAARIAEDWRPRQHDARAHQRRRYRSRIGHAQDAPFRRWGARRRSGRSEDGEVHRWAAVAAGHVDAAPDRVAARRDVSRRQPEPPPIETILSLTDVQSEDPFEQLTRREYALIACALGVSALAFLPVLLQLFGTSWRPGVRRARAA